MPLYFQSPEAIKSKIYSEKLDVWSAGILLALLFTGTPPQFLDESPFLLAEQIVHAHNKFDFTSEAWTDVSSSAIQMISSMIHHSYDQRIKAVAAHNNSWLLNLTKARMGNQRKILNGRVINRLKIFIVSDHTLKYSSFFLCVNLICVCIG
jgi:calcium-dependent protein kinase